MALPPKQQRNQSEPVAETPLREKLSEDQLRYIDGAARLQQEAQRDPYLNGKDWERRLQGDG